MVLVVLLAALLLLFLMVRNHVGVPFLAMIAGLAVAQTVGGQFAAFLSSLSPRLDPWWVERVLYVLFVAVIPLTLYFRVGKTGLFGALRIVESVIFAILLTMLLANPLADMLSFDNLARDLANWIEGIKGLVMVAGIILAYVDAFFYRST
ncbi:hypothetical protein IJM16_00920 [Candidatus Saccharibacteria bacterium]|nr:hypothetical protein [Candidatus Saccharibacteria bacterium]